jgi:hypothetical protein
VENFEANDFSHRKPKISTAISTAPVENKLFDYNNKEGFPHFHRPYYYYWI